MVIHVDLNKAFQQNVGQQPVVVYTSERIHPQGICTDSYSPSSVTELLQKTKKNLVFHFL